MWQHCFSAFNKTALSSEANTSTLMRCDQLLLVQPLSFAALHRWHRSPSWRCSLTDSKLGVSEQNRHMALVIFLVPCFVVGMDMAFSCQDADDFVGASSPGDIIIGGLFAVHSEMLHPDEEPIKPVIQNCAGWVILKIIHMAKKRPLTLDL